MLEPSSPRFMADLLGQEATRPATLKGQTAPRGQILAAMIWDYVIDGQVTVGCGDTLKPSSREWIATAKWLCAQIDGQPPRKGREPVETGRFESESDEEGAEAAGGEVTSLEQTRRDDEPYRSWSGLNRSAGEDGDTADDDEDGDDADEKDDDTPAQHRSSNSVDYEIRAQQVEAALHGVPVTQPADVPEPPPASNPPRTTYAYGSTPVTSIQHDGRVILIDRAEYERKRQQGFRNGTRHRITLPRDDG